MIYGIGTGILWAMETILLSIILSKGTFVQSQQSIFLAPFISAFLNDAISGVWLLIYRKAKRQYRRASVLKALKTKNGKILILSGLFGGPLGMTSYLLAIKYIGSSYTAVISSLYPAIGSIIAWIFLKDKLSKKQLVGMFLCTLGVIAMARIPKENVEGTSYFIFAIACAFFWGLEAVISSYAMKDGKVPFEVALQIRHGTSMICYVVLFLPLLHGWEFTLQVLTQKSILMLILTALIETGSYLLYYKAIHVIGAAKAMSLNITYMIWSVLLGILIFKEIPHGNEVISMLILISGVFLVVLYGNKDQSEKTL